MIVGYQHRHICTLPAVALPAGTKETLPPAGDAIAIDMPMTVESVVTYLGVVLAGCAVVSIADSFVASEIASRLCISQAKAIFTQVRYVRSAG